MNVWLWAAAVLTAALAAPAWVAIRRPLLDAIVALEAAGSTATLVLLLIAVGTNREPFGDLALVLALTSFAGTLAFLRFARGLE
ncbi:MAG TPA: MrpF/PhaF family protein [Solirubrobacter sp.]|nr:MrpF/PhaF family protein [Solirubrobacter sp.]